VASRLGKTKTFFYSVSSKITPLSLWNICCCPLELPFSEMRCKRRHIPVMFQHIGPPPAPHHVLEIWFGGEEQFGVCAKFGSNFHAIELCVAGLRIRSAENRIQHWFSKCSFCFTYFVAGYAGSYIKPQVKYGVRSLKFIWAPKYSCTHWLRPRNCNSPPSPPHLGSYTRALLVSQDRRHIFVIPRIKQSKLAY
jgi:hypothetical protein